MADENQNANQGGESTPIAVETSEQMANMLMEKDIPDSSADENPDKPDGSSENDEPKGGGAKPADKKPDTSGDQPVYFSGKYDPIYKILGEKGFDLAAVEEIVNKKLPDGVTEEDFLLQLIADATDVPELEDPVIKNYLDAKQNGKLDEFFQKGAQALNINNMDADTGLKFMLQNELKADGTRKWTDEQISKYLEGQTDIAKEELWNSKKSDFLNKLNVKSPEQQAADDKKWQDYLAEREKAAEVLMTEEEKVEKILGVEYTPELKKEFKAFFKEITTIDKSGRTKWSEMLDNDRTFVEIARAYFFAKHDHISKALSNLKEDYKADVLNKTSGKPKGQSGGGDINQVEPPTPKDFT